MPNKVIPTCEWYALCDHPADGAVEHPVIGWVPTCWRCANKHDLELVSAEWVVEDAQ